MTTYAFTLGVNHYEPPIDTLKCAERDARELAGLLKHQFGFEAEYLEERNAEDIESRIGALAERLRPGDQFLFYFSGHGKAQGDDMYFLLPRCRLAGLVASGGATPGVLSFRSLDSLTSGSTWRQVQRVFILDACRAPLIPPKGAGERPAFQGNHLLRCGPVSKSREQVHSPKTILNSCADGACALELPDRGYGIFTAALMGSLKDSLAGGGEIRLDAAYVEAIGRRMTELAYHNGVSGVAQSPEFIGIDIVLRPPAPWLAAPATGRALDERLWRLALAKGTVAAFETYVREAPDDAAHIDAALERIEALHQPPEVPGPEVVVVAPPAPPAATPVPERQRPGRVFRDADWAPEMVVLPRGSFMMGSPPDEIDRQPSEGPPHTVEITYAMALGRYAVTFEEFDRYARDAGITVPSDQNWGRGRRPVINVGWGEARAYIEWLNEKLGLTGRPDRYRLPSEAEWEYAARAGTTGPYSFEGLINAKKANYDARQSYEGSPVGEYRSKTVEVGTLPANPWGLHEVHGNVWEWVEDRWHGDYQGAPTDGSAWVSGQEKDRVLRGGSWGGYPRFLRSANRGRVSQDSRVDVGFRLARMLPE